MNCLELVFSNGFEVLNREKKEVLDLDLPGGEVSSSASKGKLVRNKLIPY